jgi:hypothetical protein
VDTAVAGLIGVVAGAVLTGGIQAIGAISARRLNARTSARLLCVSLHEAAVAMHTVLKHQWWGPSLDDWDRFLAPWRDHRDPLMRVLSPEDSWAVTSTFSLIERLKAIRDAEHRDMSNPEEKPADNDFSENANQVKEVLLNVVDTGGLVWKATFPSWRRAKEPSPFAKFLSRSEPPGEGQIRPEEV